MTVKRALTTLRTAAVLCLAVSCTRDTPTAAPQQPAKGGPAAAMSHAVMTAGPTLAEARSKQTKMFLAASKELKKNRVALIGKRGTKPDVGRVCSALTAVLAKHWPTTRDGAVLSAEARLAEAGKLVRSNAACTGVAPSSIFGSAAALLIMVTWDEPMTEEEAEAFVEANATEEWADGVAESELAVAEVEVLEPMMAALDLPEYDESSIFMCGIRCAMRTAFAAGCIAGARQALPAARVVMKLGALSGWGAAPSVLAGMGVITGACVGEGAVAAMVVYGLWSND